MSCCVQVSAVGATAEDHGGQRPPAAGEWGWEHSMGGRLDVWWDVKMRKVWERYWGWNKGDLSEYYVTP